MANTGLYGRKWRRLRASFLRANPLCSMCQDQGYIRSATEVDHIKKHNGDPGLFFDWDNLQGLCYDHHRSTKARMERSGKMPGCDAEGNPLKPMKHWQ